MLLNIPNFESKCKCCKGEGIQKRMTDGINIICPCCDGDGENRKINKNIKFPPTPIGEAGGGGGGYLPGQERIC